jgi:hypothetical protein
MKREDENEEEEEEEEKMHRCLNQLVLNRFSIDDSGSGPGKTALIKNS